MLAGDHIGAYRLLGPLGRGGMGDVWRAEHRQIHSQVAIKLVLGDRIDPHLEARFLREAMATAKIRHPGVVTITDYGTHTGGGAYFVMELLAGESLADRLRRGALPRATAVALALQLAEALEAAHAVGVIHRDLKPANIFLVADQAVSGGVRAKIVDFGISKDFSSPLDTTGLTATGALIGTPLYMAPEQFSTRSGEPDARADLYALGVVLYEMLVGVPPFRGPTLGDLIEQHLNGPPPADARIPADLDHLVRQLLAKDRATRPASAGAVARALRGGSSDAVGVDATVEAVTPAPLARFAETVATGVMAVGVAASAVPTRAPRPWNRRWPRIGMVAVVAGALAAIGWTAFERDTHPTSPAVDRATATDAQLETACRSSDAAACVSLADREILRPTPDLPTVFARLSSACDHADRDACARVARMYARGAGVRPDYARARAVAEASCTAGSGDGCDAAGDWIKSGLGGASDPSQAYARFVRGCDLGNPSACASVASSMHDGIGTPRDPPGGDVFLARAWTIAEPRCAANDASACHILGSLRVEGGLGKQPDFARAAADFLRACELGATDSCKVGELIALGVGVEKDVARGEQLLTRACNGGDRESCISLSLLRARGLTGKPDPDAAFALAKRACDDGGDRYCKGLAVAYRNGIGAPIDLALSRLFFERACAAGDQESCAVGITLEVPGVAHDEAKEARILETACRSGEPFACWQRGLRSRARGAMADAFEAFGYACTLSHEIYGCRDLADAMITGHGTTQDPAGGRRVLETACSVPIIDACADLARRLRDGNGMDAAPAEALRLFDRACTGGSGTACQDAAALISDRRAGLTPDPKRAAALRKRACETESSLCSSTPSPVRAPGAARVPRRARQGL